MLDAGNARVLLNQRVNTAALSRRRLLRLLVMGTGGSAVVAAMAACAPGLPSSASGPAPTAAPAAAKPLQPLTYMGDFNLTGSSGPLFLAQERGYFAQQGLDVAIQPGTGSSNTAKIVGAGSAQMGRIDGGIIIQSVGTQIPIRTVAGLVQKSPMSIIVAANANLKTPKDLEGKKLAGTPGGSQEVLFPAWMHANGADPDKVEIVSAPAATRDTVMLQGQVDGQFGFTYSSMQGLIDHGLDVVPILYADFGLNIPGLSFVANTNALSSSPDLVRGFVAAAMMGYADAVKDTQAAIDALMKQPFSAALDPRIEGISLGLMLQLLTGPRTQGHPLGWMSSDDWSSAIDDLAADTGLSPKPRVEDVITNDYVPSA